MEGWTVELRISPRLLTSVVFAILVGIPQIDDDDDGEDSLARKMREQKMVEDADIENAKDMFAGVKTAPSTLDCRGYGFFFSLWRKEE
jgi:hypothetical protein